MPTHQLLETCKDLDAILSDIQSKHFELNSELIRARELCSLLLKLDPSLNSTDSFSLLRATRVVQAGNAICLELQSLVDLQRRAKGGVLSLAAVRIQDWKAALRQAHALPEGK